MSLLHPGATLTTDPEARRREAAALAEQATAADLPLLLTFLGDDHWRVRKAAVAGFRRLPSAQSVPVLIGSLQDDANAGLRNSALEALESFGEQAVTAVHRSLREVDPDVRIALLGLLGRLGSPDSVPYVLYYLGAADRNTVAAAVAALGEIRDPSAAEVLIKQLVAADDWLAVQIIDALGEIGDAGAVPALVAATAAPGPRRRAAAVALGRIGTAAAADALLEVVAASDRPLPEALAAIDRILGRLQRRAASAPQAADLRSQLRALLPPIHQTELSRLLARAQPPVAGALARITATLRAPGLLAPLFASVLPGDLGPAEVAELRTLPEAPHALAAALHMTEGTDRRIALAQLLAALPTPNAAPDLLIALGTDDLRLRDAVIAALAECGGDSALLPLVECAVSDDGSLGAITAACRAILARAPESRALVDRRLESLLLSHDPPARRLAVALAAELAPELLAAHRPRLLRDQEAGVRRTALEHADPAQIGADELRRIVLDEAPAVRRQALRMLRQLAHDPALEDIALGDPDLWVRADAAATLAIAEETGIERGFSMLDGWPEPVAAAFLAALPPEAIRARDAQLTALAGGGRGEVARAAVEALARARSAAAIPFLLAGIESPRPARAAAALEWAGAPEFATLAPATLRRLEGREEPVIRRHALEALAAMGSPAGVPGALRLLEDETLGRAAVDYLARVKAAHPGLIRQAAESCAPRIRAMVRELLGDSA